MKFADPYLLLLLLAIPALLFLKGRVWRDDTRASFSDVRLLSSMRVTWRLRFRWLPTLMRACALALLVVALARPQKGQAQSVLPGQGIDIALVLDTSSSMSTTTLGNQTRLEVAQNVIKDFINGRKDDRIGLVVFRDESLVLSPLTLDYQALDGLLDGVSQVNLNDGTAIGLGVGESLNLLRDSKARSRVAILLTDGQNNNTQLEPLAAAKIAQTLGVRLYTIGVIDPRSRGSSGNVDEKALTEMANVTGGRYFSADSPQALASVYQNIDQLEKSRVGRPQFAAYHELALYFLAGALAFVGLEFAMSATLWRRAV
jgi:Ca-activated chloride channel family protein